MSVSTGLGDTGYSPGGNGAPRLSVSAMSWGAILAGATGAAALSVILLILGAGLGLSSVSPWESSGISATAFGVSTIVWLTLTQLLASGMGGYLAGRLRTSWPDARTDEVYFRDTAHGFLAWCIAFLASATILASAMGSVISGGVEAGSAAVGTTASAVATAAGAGSVGIAKDKDVSANELGHTLHYYVNALLRGDVDQDQGGASERRRHRELSSAQSAREVIGIFTHAVRSGALPDGDAKYLGQLVAQRTGLSQQEAEQRVRDVYGEVNAQLEKTKVAAKEAADKARAASAYAALWIFISLLVGAFVASLAATFGGRQRDL